MIEHFRLSDWETDLLVPDPSNSTITYFNVNRQLLFLNLLKRDHRYYNMFYSDEETQLKKYILDAYV